MYAVAGPVTASVTVDTEPYLGGGSAGDWLGWSIGGGADVDGDGYTDVLAGSPTADDGGNASGAVRIILGSATVLDGGAGSLASSIDIAGADVNDRLGQSVSAAGDVDGDGNDDIVVGAWKENSVGNNSGAAYVMFGPLSAGSISLATAADTVRFTGESTGDLAGWSVGGHGDVNSDGLDDVLVGSPQDDDLGADAGAAYLLLGLGG